MSSQPQNMRSMSARVLKLSSVPATFHSSCLPKNVAAMMPPGRTESRKRRTVALSGGGMKGSENWAFSAARTSRGHGGSPLVIWMYFRHRASDSDGAGLTRGPG